MNAHLARIARATARYVSLAILAVAFLLLVGVAALETAWSKNRLRQMIVNQAARYLNGNLAIRNLSGNLFTGVVLDGVALQFEGQDAVAIDRLTVRYSPLTLISEGLVLDSLTLDRPTVILERDAAGWNVARFVRTRQGTASGRGAPPITFDSIRLTDGHVIVRDHHRDLEDIRNLNGGLRFVYLKPGFRMSFSHLSALTTDVNVRQLSGDVGILADTIRVSDLTLETDRSNLRVTMTWERRPEGSITLSLAANRLSFAEVGRFFQPLKGIALEPAVDLEGNGTLGDFKMHMRFASSAGNLDGPLTAHLEGPARSLDGTLNVENVNLAPFFKWTAADRQTSITGETQFTLGFGSSAEPAGIRASFKFTGPSVQGFGYRAENVRATGAYSPGLVTFDAAAAGYGVPATSKGAFHFPQGRPLSYTLAGAFRSLDLRRLPPMLKVPEMESRLAGQYQFASSAAGWSASTQLKESTIEGAAVADGTVGGASSNDGVLRYSAAGHVDGLNPSRFATPLDLPLLGDPRLQGILNGAFTMEGSGRTVDELVLRASASVTNSTMAGARFPEASVDAQLDNRHLRMGFIGSFEGLAGSLITTTPALEGTELNGSANLKVAVGLPKLLPAELLETGGTASLTPSTVSGIAIDKGSVDADYAGRILQVRQLEVSGPTVQGTAAGTLALGDEGQSNLTYDLTASDLEPLARRIGQPVAGSVHLAGQAVGPAADLAISGKLEGSRVKYGSTIDALTLNSTYTVHLPEMDVAQIAGQADSTAAFVTVAGMNFASVEAHTQYGARQLEFRGSMAQAKRSLGVEGNVLFRPDDSELHVRALNLAVGATQWALVPGREATIHYGGGLLAVAGLQLERGQQRLQVDGTLAMGTDADPSRQHNLQVRAEAVQIADLREIMLEPRMLEGVIDATAQVRGTWAVPAVDAQFSVTKGSVQGVTYDSFAGKGTYRGDRVTLDARLQQTPGAELTIAGTMPVPGRSPSDSPIDLAIQSTPVNLALVQAFTTEITGISGQAQANLHVGGTLAAPSLQGRLEVSQAAFVAHTPNVSYPELAARLTFDGDRILIDRFEIADEDGDRLVALGEIGIQQRTLGAMNVQLSASQFKVLDNQLGQVEVDADIRITGDARRPQITGAVSAANGRLEVDRLLELYTNNPYSMETTNATRLAAVRQTAVAPPMPESSPGLYDAASVAIKVSLPDDLLLRGRNMQAAFAPIGLGDMNITVGGDVQVRKAPGGSPDLLGTISVVRGYYEFQGRRFEVLRDSQIRFEGIQPVDPALRVTAQREISGVTAFVQLRGSVKNPELSLSSSPSLDEADILSLIVFNQPINQLGENERLNLAQRAGGMAAGYLTAPLANSIADALDLDLFEIRAASDTTGQPSVALGQQFGSRLFVSFREEFGSEDRSELSLEYRINRFLRLVSSVAQGAQRTHRGQRVEANGTDLIFVIDY